MADGGEPTVRSCAYRRFDQASKLFGVGFVAAGLHAGGDSATGIALAVVGVACALLPIVFVRSTSEILPRPPRDDS